MSGKDTLHIDLEYPCTRECYMYERAVLVMDCSMFELVMVDVQMAYFLCLWCLTVNVLVWIQFVFGAIEDPSVLVEDDCTPGDDSTCPDGYCCVKEVSKTAFDFIHTFFPLETVLTKLVISFVRSFVRSFIHKKPIAHTFQYNI